MYITIYYNKFFVFRFIQSLRTERPSAEFISTMWNCIYYILYRKRRSFTIDLNHRNVIEYANTAQYIMHYTFIIIP